LEGAGKGALGGRGCWRCYQRSNWLYRWR
jgi:hypothetical protein